MIEGLARLEDSSFYAQGSYLAKLALHITHPYKFQSYLLGNCGGDALSG